MPLFCTVCRSNLCVCPVKRAEAVYNRGYTQLLSNLSGGFNSDIFAFTSKSKPSAAGLVLEKATAEWVRGSFLKKVSESDMAFTATCNIATL